MGRFVKVTVLVVLAAAVVLLTPFLIHGVRFLEHRSDIMQVIETAAPEERNLPPIVVGRV